jgi:hypothetical protein
VSFAKTRRQPLDRQRDRRSKRNLAFALIELRVVSHVSADPVGNGKLRGVM